jgi:aspartate 1-decarboxylase
VIICSYVQLDDSECQGWEGTRVFVDNKNVPHDLD